MINENLLGAILQDSPSGDLYVFAYGSLMWNPGFSYISSDYGRIWGYSRCFAVWSFHYRGTPQRRGLAFGLDVGGSCCGMVYRVRREQRSQVVRHLIKREMLTDIYRPLFLPVKVRGKTRRALVFVVCHDSEQYAPPMPDGQKVKIILSAAGVAGSNADYVRNTYRCLEENNIAAPALRRFCRLLDAGVK